MSTVTLPEGKTQVPTETTAERANLKLDIRPSWMAYLWYYVLVIFIFPPILAVLKHSTTRLQLREGILSVESGILSKDRRSAPVEDVVTVDVHQGALQRAMGVGDIMIATAGTGGWEFRFPGVPHPERIAAVILGEARSSRSSVHLT